MICPNCGHRNSDEDKFCGECGNALSSAATTSAAETSTGSDPIGSPNPATPSPGASRATYYPTSTAGSGAKSKMTAGILGLVLGAFGIHRFYLGYTGIGIVQVIVTLVTFGFGGIWGFVEGILILTGSFNKDANGNPLGD